MLDPLKANMVVEEDETADGDVFVQKDDGEGDGSQEAAPDSFEELPIEIRSLTERYDAAGTHKWVHANRMLDSSSRSQPKSILLLSPSTTPPTCSKTSTPAPQPRSTPT
jgi:hypothetical protein